MGPFKKVVYTNDQRFINSWSSESSQFVNALYAWFTRGGSHNNGLESSVFSFDHGYGFIKINISFRIVLSATE